MNNILNAAEVSRDFFNGKISYWTVLQMAKTGALPCFRNGKRYLFDRSALDQWKTGELARPFWSKA